MGALRANCSDGSWGDTPLAGVSRPCDGLGDVTERVGERWGGSVEGTIDGDVRDEKEDGPVL